jgi:hypothetical protein
MNFNVHKWNKQRYLAEAGIYETATLDLAKEINKILPESLGYKEFAKAVAKVLRDEYGSQNFKSFMNVLHDELGMEPLDEAKNNFYPDSPEALSAAIAKAREILDKHKASIKAIADKYKGQSSKGKQMQDELNALIDADLKGIPFEDYVSNKVKATLGKALFRYYASKNPELAKIMK